ncbi:hypothetical protein GEMRC1_008224 [Eukaryota sp. GEM-RC1]
MFNTYEVSFSTNEVNDEFKTYVAENGSFVRCLNVPSNDTVSIGIDLSVYPITASPSGIHFIPTGLHFLYISSTNCPVVQSFFHFFEQSTFLEIMWKEDTITTTVSSCNSPLDFEKASSFCYPLHLYKSWLEFSFVISKNVCQDFNLTYSTLLFSDQYLSTSLSFPNVSKLPLALKPFSPSERSRLALDQSWRLEALWSSSFPSSLFGQLQSCFILFYLGQCFDGLVQWINVLELISQSQSFLIKYSAPLLRVLKSHLEFLKQVGDDSLFFTNSSERSLPQCLSRIRSVLVENKSICPVVDELFEFFSEDDEEDFLVVDDLN